MQKLEHYIRLRETISQDLPPIGYQTAYNFINFMYSCFQPAFLFLLASFCLLFLDIARYACKNPTKSRSI